MEPGNCCAADGQHPIEDLKGLSAQGRDVVEGVRNATIAGSVDRASVCLRQGDFGGEEQTKEARVAQTGRI
jgi:hypothetical protein